MIKNQEKGKNRTVAATLYAVVEATGGARLSRRHGHARAA